MKSLKEQITGRCKNITSIGRNDDDTCKAGHKYTDIMKFKELGQRGCILRLPCTGRKAGTVDGNQIVQDCPDYTPQTEAEIQAEIDKHNKFIENLEKGLSDCCQAPIDESRVIKTGEYENHGPRYCSKCHKLVYMV